MRVIFIQENAISEILGFCNLSAYLKQNGHHCDLLLLTHTQDWLKDIRDFAPDLIGFSIYTGMQASTYELIREIKKHFNIPIIGGGPHPTYYPKECMQECPEIDMICRGEGEKTLLRALENLNVDYIRIPGLWVRRGEKIIDNGISALIDDVNALPLPDRGIYNKHNFLKDFPVKRFISGHGCPYNCSFCNQPFFRKEYRKEYSGGSFIRRKSVDYIIREILTVKESAKLKLVHFSDDFFFPKGEWMREFSSKYPKKVGLPFSCTLRFDSLNDERVKRLKDTGCHGVQIGIESGSERLRNRVIGKQLAVESIVEGARLLRKYGIKMYSTNIIGLPGETLNEALETIKLNRRIKVHFARVNTWMAFPNSALCEYAMNNGYLSKGYSLNNLNIGDSLHIHCKTAFANEFKNIACLFWLLIKLPFAMRFVRLIIRMKNNTFFQLCGILNMLQDVRFLRVDLFSGIRFYLNTLYRAKKGYAIHWWSGLDKLIKGKNE